MPIRAGSSYASAFAQALDEQLGRRGLMQKDLAGATGVSPSYVNRLMKGARVSPEWVDIIAETLKLAPADQVKLHEAAAVTAGYKIGKGA